MQGSTLIAISGVALGQRKSVTADHQNGTSICLTGLSQNAFLCRVLENRPILLHCCLEENGLQTPPRGLTATGIG